METKRLKKSSTNKVLCGVCGGIAEYFNMDATVVRVITVLLACFGVSILAYIIIALIMPAQ